MVENSSLNNAVNTVDMGQHETDNKATKTVERNFHLVTGTQWRRIKPENYEHLNTPISYVMMSYTMRYPCFTTQECIKELKWMQKGQMFKVKLGDIRFNFLIGGDGSVYEIRGWTNKPTLMARLNKFNSRCLYIGFMGSFKNEPPEPRMFKAQRELLKYGVRCNYITPKFNLFTIKGQLSNQLSFMQMEEL